MGRKSPLGIEGTGLSFRDPDAANGGRLTVAMARVKDEAGRWQSKRFQVQSWRKDGSPIVPVEAVEWARALKKSFVRGEATAGKVSFPDFLIAVGDGTKDSGHSEDRALLFHQLAKAMRDAGIINMQAVNFADRVRRWLTDLQAGWSMPVDHQFRKKPRPLAPATKNRYLICIKQAVNLAMLRRRIAYDPLAELKPFKTEDFIKPTFTIAELRHIVSDAARDRAAASLRELESDIRAEIAGVPGTTRTNAIVAIAKLMKCHWTTIYNMLKHPAGPDPWWLPACLLIYTGCRAQEAMHLRWEWVDFDAGIITLKLADDYDQKSATERIMPLEPELADILKPLRPADGVGHIVPPSIRAGSSGLKPGSTSPDGKGARDYTNAMRLYLKRIGIDPGERTCHSTRHTFVAIKCARIDTNLVRLRKAVGHESLSTTEGYANLSPLYEREVDTWPDRTLWLRRPVPGQTAT